MNKNIFVFCLILASVIFSNPSSFAKSESEVMNEAATDVSNKLKTNSGRKELIGQDPKALEAAKMVKTLAGDKETENEIYNIGADLIPYLSQKAGSPEELQKMIQEAQTNPEKFLQSLPPDIQAKIKGIADKKEKANKKP